MLPEGRRAHVGAMRHVVDPKRLDEVLLEPGHSLRNLLTGRSRGDETQELRAVRACEQTNDDLLLDQWRQPRRERRLLQQRNEPDERVEQGRRRAVRTRPLDRRRPAAAAARPSPTRSARPTGRPASAHAQERLACARSRDVGHDRQVDGRQHRLRWPVVDRLASELDLLVALRDHAETQVVDAVQRLGRSRAAVQCECRNGGVVVAVALGKPRNRSRKSARSRSLERL